MNKVILLAFLVALPSLADALEDTHGVLVDRGIVRSKTGMEAAPAATDAGQPDATTDKTKDNQDKSDNTVNNKPQPLANVPQNYKKIANNAGINAQNYYRAKHSGFVNTHVEN